MMHVTEAGLKVRHNVAMRSAKDLREYGFELLYLIES